MGLTAIRHLAMRAYKQVIPDESIYGLKL